MAIGDGAHPSWNSYIGWNEEAEITTHTTTADGYIEFYSESLKINREETLIPVMGSPNRAQYRRFTSNRALGGSVTGPFTMDHIWLMKHGLTPLTTSVAQYGATTAYWHRIIPGNYESTSSDFLELQIKRGAVGATPAVWYYPGCRINQMTVKSEVDNLIEINYDFIGGGDVKSGTATTTVAFTSVQPFSFIGSHVVLGTSLTMAATGTSIAGASTMTVLGWEIVVNNNIVADDNNYRLGSALKDNLPLGTRDVTVNLTFRDDTTTSYTEFLGGSMTAMQIVFGNGQTISTASQLYQGSFFFPRMYWNGSEANVANVDGVQTVTIPFRAISVSDSGITSTMYDMWMEFNSDRSSAY